MRRMSYSDPYPRPSAQLLVVHDETPRLYVASVLVVSEVEGVQTWAHRSVDDREELR